MVVNQKSGEKAKNPKNMRQIALQNSHIAYSGYFFAGATLPNVV
jgi:hypothetical protein